MAAAQHPLFARLYARCISPSLRRIGADSLRRRALEGLSGTVVDVGAGDGANFAFYPDAVEHVVAVEPDPFNLECLFQNVPAGPGRRGRRGIPGG